MLLAVNDFPPILGGESTLYHGLVRHLPPGEALVLAPRRQGDGAIDDHLPVRVLRRFLPEHGGTARRLARTGWGFAHLLRLLGARRFDYVVCGQLLSLGGPTRLLANLRRIPYAVFVHGADLLDYHDRLLWGAVARWVIAGADTVLVNSRFTGALVERLLPGVARRVVVVPMGVDPPVDPSPEASAALRVRYDLGHGPILLTVARLVAIKGHDVVLAGLPELLHARPDLRYLVVGEGPRRAALEQMAAELGVAHAVRFAGRIPHQDLAAHFRLATIYVQLSRLTGSYDGVEGFGLSFLEAASHGVPSIGGRSGGVEEAVQDGVTGLLVPPSDPTAFVTAATRLLEDPSRRARMAAAAQAWAASHSWKRSAAALQSLWKAA